MKKLVLSLSLIFVFAIGRANDLEDFFSEADTFFKKYVKDGMVNYKGITQNLSSISTLYKTIGNMDLSGASDVEKKAFYINAYNLVVIYQVANYYPLSSPLDQSGFFDKVRHKVAGEMITLNHLEIKNLLLKYSDPRIHFALACAAKSCPPLGSFAYNPEQLDQQLYLRTAMALNDPDWLRIDKNNRTIYVSKIFDWYKKDFNQNGQDTRSFINKFRSIQLPESFEIKFYDYDWSLNEN